MRSRTIAAVGLGYLIGTFPSADLAARLATKGTVDLRTTGSGNPGGANAAAVLGKRWGYAVMAADVAKGALAGALARRIAGDSAAHAAGTAAVIGHCFPVWSRGRGGKGVATSAGQCLATFPAYVPFDLALVVATGASKRWRRRAFVATSAGIAGWIGAALLWWRRDWPNLWGPRPSKAMPAAALASGAVIIYKFATAKVPQ